MNSSVKTLYVLSFLLLQHLSSFSQHPSKELAAKIDSYLQAGETNGYSGAVLVAKGDEILLSKGYGWADREKEIRNTPSMVINIGSVTKQFTAAAILKLMENDALKTSDPILKYFSQAPADKQHITIHQLLTHTSGVSPQTGGFRYDPASKEQFLEAFFRSELLHEPGTKHTYANANYILLAAIIEQVAQQDYETYLREQFWDPLQMDHTGYKDIAFNNDMLSHGYYFHYTDGTWRDWGTTVDYLPAHNKHWYSIGKGDLYSTVEDLYTWHKALENHSVLEARTKRIMETAYVAENEEQTSFYGYGWAIFNAENNTKIVAHNGSNGIYFADFIRGVDEDIVVIALSNKWLNHQSENVAWEIMTMLTEGDHKPQLIPKNTYELVFDFMRANSPDKVEQLPQFVKEQTGNPIRDRAILNRIGFKQVTENRDTEWGLALLQLNTSLFQVDGNLWDTLGEAYYLLDDQENAIMSFKKALTLKPSMNCHWCDNSSNRLKEILDN